MLLAFFFGIVGVLVTCFTVLSALICIAFGIPTTKKLERAGMLINNHLIIKRYWISTGILVTIFVSIFGAIYVLGSVHALVGYICGSVCALIVGVSKIGKNENNLSDYINTQSHYFNQPKETIIDFLNN